MTSAKQCQCRDCKKDRAMKAEIARLTRALGIAEKGLKQIESGFHAEKAPFSRAEALMTLANIDKARAGK